MNLILVDDDPDEAYLLRQALKKVEPDSSLEYFSDGRDFLSELNKRIGQRALVLLDLNMPNLDGFEVLKEVKSNQSTLNIPIVVYSNSNNPKDIELSYKTGANSYVRKPQGLTETIEFVSSLINYWQRINET